MRRAFAGGTRAVRRLDGQIEVLAAQTRALALGGGDVALVPREHLRQRLRAVFEEQVAAAPELGGFQPRRVLGGARLQNACLAVQRSGVQLLLARDARAPLGAERRRQSVQAPAELARAEARVRGAVKRLERRRFLTERNLGVARAVAGDVGHTQDGHERFVFDGEVLVVRVDA